MLFRILRPAALALVLAAMAAPTRAEEGKTYEGVAGASRIVLELSESGGEAFGQYFYESSRLDIDLSGQWRGQALQLTSNVTGDRMGLSRSGTGLAGVLTTAKGRKFRVVLNPAVAPANAPADLPGDLGLYGRLQLAGLTLQAQQAETVGGRTLRWYREPKTGIRLFRLERGYAAPAMAAMNRALARNQWAEVSAFLGCVGSDGGPGAEVSEAETPWLGPAYVSYLWRSSWDCAGAAHPDFGQTGHTFDARSGREVSLDELLPVGQTPAPSENSDAWLEYRGQVFAPAVVALLKRHHPREMARPKSEDGCDYSDPGVWDFPSWGVTEKGLWLGAVFPRVMRVCDSPDWAILPWSALPEAARRSH